MSKLNSEPSVIAEFTARLHRLAINSIVRLTEGDERDFDPMPRRIVCVSRRDENRASKCAERLSNELEGWMVFKDKAFELASTQTDPIRLNKSGQAVFGVRKKPR